MLKLFCFSLLFVLMVLISPEPGMAGNETATNPIKYIVNSGDNLYDIGQKYGISAEDIKRQNQLDSNLIRPGQVLTINVNRAPSNSTSRGLNGYSREEADLLARLIRAEAASEPYQAKLAVGAVVLNRLESSQYPNSIRGVIYQSTGGVYQFTPVYNGSINRPADSDSLRAAEEALRGADPTGGALFFFNSWVKDTHLNSRTISKIIGKLTFAL